MKSITVIGVLICVLPAKVSADLASEVKANIKAIFELWKAGDLQNRLPFEIPPVEPFPLPPFCDNINKLGVKAYVETGILECFGLKELSIDKLEVSETANDFSATMSAPQVRLHSDTYSIKGKAMKVYKVKGTGTLDITVFNVKGNGKVHLKPTSTGTEIDQFTVHIAAERAEGNLQNSSFPINNLINTKGHQLVEAFKVEIQRIATKLVQKIFKEPLSKIKFDDLLQYTKDILDNTLIKRSNSADNFDEFSVIDNDSDVLNGTVVPNALRDSTGTAAEDTFHNSPDFRKILNGSLFMRLRN